MSTGMPEQLQWLRQKLESKYQVKTQILGLGKEHLREVKILNRVVGWYGNEGIKYEADPRHIEIIIDHLGFKDAKLVSSPGTSEEGHTQLEHEEQLGSKEISQYRAIVARCNYIAPDRPDIAYAVKELARHMANPTCRDGQRQKGLGGIEKDAPDYSRCSNGNTNGQC